MAKDKKRTLEEIQEELKAFDKMLGEGEEKYFNTDDFWRIIMGYLINDEPEKALVALEYAKKLHPGTVVFLIHEGMILNRLDRNEEAIEVLNRAALIYPTDYMVYNTRSKCYFQIQEPELARADIDKAEECGYDFAEAIGYKEDPDRTIFKKKMVEMEPFELFNEERIKYSSDFETLKKIVEIYRFSHEEKGVETINFFNKIAQDNPSSADRWMFLGEIYCSFSKGKEAIESFDFSLSLNPENAYCYNLKAHHFRSSDKYEEAILNFRLSIEYSKPTDDYFYPKYEETKQEENIPYMYYFIGDCYMRSRQYKNAEIAYRKYSELNPENDCPWYSIGLALGKQGLHKESIGYFEKALELDEEYSSYVYCIYAYALFKAGLIKKSQIAFDRILEDEYFSDGFYYYYPQFLWGINKKEEAFEELEKGIKEHPVYDELFYIKAMFYYRLNDRKNGNKFLNTALKLDFDGHFLLFEYAPELENDKEILKVIETFGKKNNKGKS